MLTYIEYKCPKCDGKITIYGFESMDKHCTKCGETTKKFIKIGDSGPDYVINTFESRQCPVPECTVELAQKIKFCPVHGKEIITKIEQYRDQLRGG